MQIVHKFSKNFCSFLGWFGLLVGYFIYCWQVGGDNSMCIVNESARFCLYLFCCMFINKRGIIYDCKLSHFLYCRLEFCLRMGHVVEDKAWDA